MGPRTDNSVWPPQGACEEMAPSFTTCTATPLESLDTEMTRLNLDCKRNAWNTTRCSALSHGKHFLYWQGPSMMSIDAPGDSSGGTADNTAYHREDPIITAELISKIFSRPSTVVFFNYFVG